MKLVIFGLAVSSSWGNGHATLWRGLCRALAASGHRVVFFEQDVPYYASHRDLIRPHGWTLRLYREWDDVRESAERELCNADVGMVTSYCPDGIAAAAMVLSSRARVRCFYDMDTPVTLQRVSAGEAVDYIGPDGLASFDLVLSYTGGAALTEPSVPVLSDAWEGLERFFEPGREILICRSTEEAIDAQARARELIGLLAAPHHSPVHA